MQSTFLSKVDTVVQERGETPSLLGALNPQGENEEEEEEGKGYMAVAPNQLRVSHILTLL